VGACLIDDEGLEICTWHVT